MARTCTIDERNLIGAAHVNHHCRVEVQTLDGTWVDLGLVGPNEHNLFDSAAWGETEDQPVGSGTFTIRRSVSHALDANGNPVSVAPWMEDSPLNTAEQDGVGDYEPLLDAGRGIRTFTAVTAHGVAPEAGDWKPGFQGRIRRVAWQDSPITIEADDLAQWLKLGWFEYESAGTNPEGTPVEELIQLILDSFTNPGIPGGDPVTLSCPVSPGLMLGQWEHPIMSKLDKIVEYASIIGWDLRYRYDASDDYRFTLSDPDLGNETPHWELGPTEYLKVRRLELDDTDVRNKLRIMYYANRYFGGTLTPELRSVTREVPASQEAYGVRFAEIALPDESQIDSLAEATTFADALLARGAWPPCDQEIETYLFWPVQLWDLFAMQPNGDHYDVETMFWCVGYRHEFRNGTGRTTLTTRKYRAFEAESTEGPTGEPPGGPVDCTPYDSDDLVILPNTNGWWNDKDDGWLINEQVIADIPSGVDVNVGEAIVNVHPDDSSLGYRGLSFGGNILFGGANAYGLAQACRTFTGFEPFRVYWIQMLSHQFSSTDNPATTSGNDFGSNTTLSTSELPYYKWTILEAVYETPAGDTTDTVLVEGYAVADRNGEIGLCTMGEIKHSLCNFIAYWSLIGIEDRHCDEDWEEPEWTTWEQPTVEITSAALADADTLEVKFTFTDPDGTNAARRSIVYAYLWNRTTSEWDQVAGITYPLYTSPPLLKTAGFGDPTYSEFTWTIDLPADGYQQEWKLELHWMDDEDNEIVIWSQQGAGTIAGEAVEVGGDLDGTVGNPTVIGIGGVPLIGTPTDGQAYVYTPTGGPGSTPAYVATDVATQAELDAVVAAGAPSPRATFNLTTGSTANGTTITGTLALSKLCALVGPLTADRECWLRLYSTTEAATDDTGRDRDDPPTAGTGVLLDVVFDTGALTVFPEGRLLANEEVPALDEIYYAITNDSGATSTITITGRAVPLES